VSIRWYGIGYAVAILVGGALVCAYVLARGTPRGGFDGANLWAIVIGLLGARLYYVVQNGLPFYLAHQQHILAFWEGGMALKGGKSRSGWCTPWRALP